MAVSVVVFRNANASADAIPQGRYRMKEFILATSRNSIVSISFSFLSHLLPPTRARPQNCDMTPDELPVASR